MCFCKKTVERLWGFNISLFRFCEFDGFNGSKLIPTRESHMATNLVHPSKILIAAHLLWVGNYYWEENWRCRWHFDNFDCGLWQAPPVAVASCACDCEGIITRPTSILFNWIIYLAGMTTIIILNLKLCPISCSKI